MMNDATDEVAQSSTDEILLDRRYLKILNLKLDVDAADELLCPITIMNI